MVALDAPVVSKLVNNAMGVNSGLIRGFKNDAPEWLHAPQILNCEVGSQNAIHWYDTVLACTSASVPTTVNWAVEVKEYQKGLSYGANDIRDGVNLNQQVRYQPLITKTDIQFLPRNHAFVRLPDNYPIAKLEIPIFKQKAKPWQCFYL
mgnify:CR=1 FL=1